MKRKRLLPAATLLAVAAFILLPMKASARQLGGMEYYCYYEDGTRSQVTVMPRASRIYANGTPLIFKDGKMYEDVAPYGVLDKNDRHIYTCADDDFEPGSPRDYTKDYLESRVTIYPASWDDTEYGDVSLYIEDTNFHGLNVNHVGNTTIGLKNSYIYSQCIQNINGDLNYKTSDVKDAGGLYFENRDGYENKCWGDSVIKGNVNVTLEKIGRISIDTQNTVWGNINYRINQSQISQITLAHNVGHNGTGGNVNLEMNDTTSNSSLIGMWSAPSGAATIDGNVDFKITGSKLGMIWGYTSYTEEASNSSDPDVKNVVKGKSTITLTDTVIYNMSDRSYDGNAADISKTAVAYLNNVTVTSGGYDSPICCNEVHLRGPLMGAVACNHLIFEDGGRLIGDAEILSKLSGNGEFCPVDDYMAFASGASIADGAKIKVVPVRQATDGSYVAYKKGEQLANQTGILFYNRQQLNNYSSHFTCDYNELDIISKGFQGYPELRVRNSVPCTSSSHRWARAADSGWLSIEEYAKKHDVPATCTETGLETWYCTACLAYDTNMHETPARGHNYVADSVVEPTTSTGGYTVYSCTRCDASYQADYTDPLPDNSSGNDTNTPDESDTDAPDNGNTTTPDTPSGGNTSDSSNTDTPSDEDTVISVSDLDIRVASSIAYTGKAVKPAVTVKNGDEILKNGTDYKLAYKNNKKIGTAAVVVTGMGNYNGSAKLSFKIVPKKAVLSAVQSKKAKTVSVKWKRDNTVTGYVIQYSTDKNFKKNVKKVTIGKNKTTSATIKKLRSKKIYYVKVASYKKVSGKTYTGKYSNVKKVKVK